MDGARTRALAIVEIVALIVSHLDSPRHLLACCTVNRTFSHEAVQRLWAGSLTDKRLITPDVATLGGLVAADSARIDYYMSPVKYLHLHRSQHQRPVLAAGPAQKLLHDRLLTSAKPLLIHVDFSVVKKEIVHGQDLSHLLHENLRCLILEGGAFLDRFLQEIQEKCPRLEVFHLENDSDFMTPRAFFRFLTASSIKALHVGDSEPHMLSAEAFRHLACRPNLQGLSLDKQNIITSAMIEQIQSLQSGPVFSSLRYISLQDVPGDPLGKLLRVLTKLQIVDLEVDSTAVNLSTDVLAPLSANPQLLSLRIVTDASRHPSFASLLHLARGCPMLRQFDLRLGRERSFNMADMAGARLRFSLEELEHLAKSLSRIEVLSIPYPCGLTPQCFEVFSRYCKKLSHLYLQLTRFNILELDFDEAPYQLLALKHLKVAELLMSIDEAAVRQHVNSVDHIIKETMPALRVLDLTARDTPSQEQRFRLQQQLNDRAKERTSDVPEIGLGTYQGRLVQKLLGWPL